MSKKKDGGYAFPRKLPNINVSPEEAIELIERYSGITLRDACILSAINGLCSSIKYQPTSDPRTVVCTAITIADIYIEERDK